MEKKFNKPNFMSFASGTTSCTFVLSIRTNGGDSESSGRNIDHRFETFHEIIYGKSERGANERRVFFVPVSWVGDPQLRYRISSSIIFPVEAFGSMMRSIAASVGAMSVMLTGL